MCLAAPVKIMSRSGETAVVDSGGLRKTVNAAFTPQARPGDYVLVHAGFAIQVWSEADVHAYQAIQNEMDEVLNPDA